MKDTAPPDIAERFRTALKAITTSASRLKPGRKLRDAFDPVFSKSVNPVFGPVDKYKCH